MNVTLTIKYLFWSAASFSLFASISADLSDVFLFPDITRDPSSYLYNWSPKFLFLSLSS